MKLLPLLATLFATAVANQPVDYVIVGGGIAGLVVAETLSRDPDVRVLILEAGPDGTNDARINVPSNVGQLIPTQFSWNFSSQPDPNLSGLAPALSQGHAWGGGSAINYEIYCRGAASVFDEWANVSGDKGLGWENLIHDFKKTVHYGKYPIDYDPGLNLSAYGNGPLEVSSNRDTLGFNLQWAAALRDVLDLPVADFNDGTGIGVTNNPYTVRATNRTRHYALPAFGWQTARRPNVQMIHDAWVSRIGFNRKRAENVTYHLGDNSTHTVCAKEIIVAAGALNSPKLLMLSGIGPKRHLKDLGIPVVANHPNIGARLYDHHYSFLEYEVTSEVDTSWQRTENATYIAIAQAGYADNGNGPLGSSGGAGFALARVPDHVFESVNSTYNPPLPCDRGNLLFQASLAPRLLPAPNISIITPFVAIVQPQAHGHLRLNSSNFRDDPLIYSNYYGSPGDKAAILYGYKLLREIMKSPHVAPLIVREIFPGANVTSDEGLWKAIQRTAHTFYHPVGTVPLGKVLDKNWRIKGLAGIRVVDSSTFPSLPNCHTQGTTYGYAHHVAGVIRREDGKKYGR